MKPKLKLLILEDNQDDILLLEDMMTYLSPGQRQDTEFEFVFLSSLKEGVEYLASQCVDLIILDLSLSDSSRLDTLQNVCKSCAATEIPIIVLTALDDKETGIESVRMGAQEYLVKGQITAELLLKSIRYALERHRLKLQLKKETDILKQNEEQLIKIIINDPDGVLIVDSNESVRFINPAAEKLLDRSRKSYIGKRFEFPIPINESTNREIEIVHRGGEIITAEIRGVKIDWQEENAWLISLRDISRKKKLLNAFAEEKERLDVTLRSIADGVIAADEKEIVNIINFVACEMTGWTPEEAIGKPLFDILKLKNKTTRGIAAPVDTGADDWVLITKDENELPIEFSHAPVRKQNVTMGSVWVIRDITDKKEWEEETLRVQNLEALGVLAGGIAHEYNNILTSILGYISLAKNVIGADDNRLLSKLKKVECAALRAKEISARLLTFSKGGEPRKKIECVVKTLRSVASVVLKYSNIRVDWQIDDDLWLANFDSDQVSLAIKNIYKNAVEAMPEGGKITIKCENIKIPDIKFTDIKRGNYVKISIIDQGIGIPAERLKKIFSPYFTTKEKAEGMGLTTAYSIIRKHGGWIRVKHTGVKQKGCTVTILLPAVTVLEDREEAKIPVPKVEQAPSRKGKVLIMDDDEFIREVAMELLDILDYDTVATETGEEAVSAYRAALESGDPFDAVILDLVVPSGMGGKECIRKLLEIDRKVKAIVSSGYSNDPVIANYGAYGFSGVLPKPYQIHELTGVLEKLK